MNNRLAGKIAFVTGAGSGIGQAICEHLLAEGAKVAAVDIDAPRAEEWIAHSPAKNRALAVACDVGDADSVRAAIARTVEAFGGLNVLCNNAGGSTPQDGPVTDVPESEFWRAIRVDLFGTFLCCKFGIPELEKAGGGSVINMTSVHALIGTTGGSCYVAAKGGVVSLTRSMATSYAFAGVRVNAISPGITMTPRVRGLLAAETKPNLLLSQHLLGAAESEDIAQLAVFLASDESKIITGQILAADGGASMR